MLPVRVLLHPPCFEDGIMADEPDFDDDYEAREQEARRLRDEQERSNVNWENAQS